MHQPQQRALSKSVQAKFKLVAGWRMLARLQPKYEARSVVFNLRNNRRTLISGAAAVEAAVIANDSLPTASVQPGEASTGPPPFLWERRWVPVSPVSYLDATRPLPVTLLGQALVVWHHATEGWVVMRDACPHRLAPLSEGRLEAGGTRLACAYHGWEFNETGACTKVPQLSADARASATACSSPRSCATSFPTLLHDGMLFVWLDGSEEGRQEARQTPPPKLMDDGAKPALGWFFSEVPNDYSFWVEQGMDPSHANFLHQGLGGLKEANFLPMPGKPVKGIDVAKGYTWEHGAYEKKLAGMKAVREFDPPFIVRARYETPDGKVTYFCTMTVPVRPGVCRSFFATAQPTAVKPGEAKGVATAAASAASKPDAASKPGAASTPRAPESNSDGGKPKTGSFPGSLVARLLPKLFRHWFFLGGHFADQDVLMMCRQEHVMRSQGLTQRDYQLNSAADVGVRSINNWMKKVGYPASLWGDRPLDSFPGQTYPGWPARELPLEQLLSRQERHVRHCVECQRAMKLVAALCTAATAAAALAGVVAAALAMVAVMSPLGPAAVGGWGWIAALAVAAGGLAVAAARGWEFYEATFLSAAKSWRRMNGFAGFKKPAV